MHFIGIAWKNLERNRRRTISTILAILIGVGLIVFVNGFNDGLSGSWSRDLIDGRSGHFKLQHKDYKDFVSTDLEKILISDPEMLRKELLKNPHVVDAMTSVPIMGLVGQEEKSTTFLGHAYDVNKVAKVLPTNSSPISEGKGLTPDDLTGAVLGKMLADSLNVKVGDELMILSNSIYSESTAILINVKGLLTLPGEAEVEQNLLITDIAQVQTDLLDIDMAAAELLVRIDSDENLEPVLEWVNQHFKERGEPWVAVPWYNDKQYQQVVGMFNGIALVVAIVLSLLVGIVISESLLMSIMERIREIGSIRAIGTEKRQVYLIFYLEALIISLVGTACGLLFGSILVWIGGKVGIPLFMSEDMSDRIYPIITTGNLIISTLIPLIVTLIAVLFPVRSSCRMKIVDALNYR